MTVLLVILTIILFLGIDWMRGGHKKWAATDKQEIYFHGDGLLPTMADGGEKICDHCGQPIKTK